MKYRLGLDLGANSLGWCCLELDDNGEPIGLLDAGVRVFPDGRDPKTKTSLAAERRMKRSMRRNRDRYLQRRRALLNALQRLGLMPEDESERRRVATLDPYPLRGDALDRPLEPHELGRVLFHINQRRGFKSNRKVDAGDADEAGLIRTAAKKLQEQLESGGHATLGSYLADRHAEREPVRIRLAGRGKDKNYPFYPLRALVEAEFDAIRDKQATHQKLSPAQWEELRNIIFHQRPLKPVTRGRCWLEPDEYRGYRAMPITQAFRIAQDLANLRIAAPGRPGRELSDIERKLLYDRLRKGTSTPFKSMRKLLKLASEEDFNLETIGRSELQPDQTAKRLGSKKCLGSAWHALTLDQQDQVVHCLLESETDEECLAGLEAAGIDAADGEKLLRVPLAEGTAALSEKAMRAILPFMTAGRRYDQAVQDAGYAHHSDQRTGEIMDRLPYYGEILGTRLGTGSGDENDPPEVRWGKIPNPTVHVALNQLRRVVNRIVEIHGPPEQIVVETLRELGRSKVQRQEYEKQQKENQAANDRRREMLTEMGQPINAKNLVRLRLWEEQAEDLKDRRCPFSGAMITARLALSDEIEEDHLLPFSQTLDDSTANRVLVTREANRRKGKRTPFEAFAGSPDWEQILESAETLPPQKRWRFTEDALERYAEDGDFLARHLTDSAFIARYAKMYIEVLSPGNVWSTPGRLTAMLRRTLGLNSDTVLGRGGRGKDRNDHRHHAIDAIVVALTSRSLLKRVSTSAKRGATSGRRLLDDLDPPWKSFIEDVARRVRGIVVSHKPDTDWQAALHNETAYGSAASGGKSDDTTVVRRQPIDALEKVKVADVSDTVRDSFLAARIEAALELPTAAERLAALDKVVDAAGRRVRRVRTLERLKEVEPIRDRRTGQAYKLVKRDGNHRFEVWRLPDGKLAVQTVSTFDAAQEATANRLGRTPPKDLRPHPAARRVMRLHKNDCVALTDSGVQIICRVVMTSRGRISLAPTHEGGDLRRRNRDSSDPFKYQDKGRKAFEAGEIHKVWVDEVGRVHESPRDA